MARKFCVLTVGRAGSTSLMEALEKVPDLAVPRTNVESEDNELVHPRHVKRYAEEYGKLVKRKLATQAELIDAFYEVNEGATYAGFKSMPNRHRDYARFAGRKDIQFITLQRRDLASTAASFHRANETGTWRRHGEPRPDSWTFDVPRDVVWKAWTERASLMQWFGPKGFTMPAARMDLRPGGSFHYCLCTPDDKEMWGKFVYRVIEAPEQIVLVNSFSDEEGGLTRHPFSATWPLEMLSTTTLVEEGGKTKLTIQWSPLNPTDEERKTFDSSHEGMKQGWTGTFDQLAAYLAKA